MPIRSLNLVGGLLNFSESLGLHAPEVRALRGGGGVVSNRGGWLFWCCGEPCSAY